MVEYENMGSFTLLPSQFKSYDLELIKEEILDGAIKNGAIDTEYYQKEIKATITFKNMTKEKIENLGEFQGF